MDEGPFEATSLSETSDQVLAAVQRPVVIESWFSRELPVPYENYRQEFARVSGAFARSERARIQVLFLDPADPGEARRAAAAGVPSVTHIVLPDPTAEYVGTVAHVEGHRGFVVRSGGRSVLVPALESTARLEYDIARAILEVGVDRPEVGIVTGHGGPGLEGTRLVRVQAGHLAVRALVLDAPVPEGLAAVLLLGTTTRFTEAELGHLAAFVARGGSLGVFGNGLEYQLEGAEPSVSFTPTGVGDLLRAWGIATSRGVVLDTVCGQVPYGVFRVPVPYPPLLTVSVRGARTMPGLGHETTQMLYASSIVVSEPFGELGGEVLASSSGEAWLSSEDAGFAVRAPGEWHPDSTGTRILLASLEARLPHALQPGRRGEESRVVVGGTSSFFMDQFMRWNDRSSADTAASLMEWLARSVQLAPLRARRADERTALVTQSRPAVSY